MHNILRFFLRKIGSTFFVRQDVFSSKDTSCQEVCCKEGCKITKKTLIGSTKTKEEVKMSSKNNIDSQCC
jgi:hypothetical protein